MTILFDIYYKNCSIECDGETHDFDFVTDGHIFVSIKAILKSLFTRKPISVSMVKDFKN